MYVQANPMSRYTYHLARRACRQAGNMVEANKSKKYTMGSLHIQDHCVPLN